MQVWSFFLNISIYIYKSLKHIIIILMFIIVSGIGTLTGGNYIIVLQFLWLISIVVNPIILLNMLIAILVSTFEKINKRAETELNYLRANIVLEQEVFMTQEEKMDPKNFPPFLHVLVPHGQNKIVKKVASEDDDEEAEMETFSDIGTVEVEYNENEVTPSPPVSQIALLSSDINQLKEQINSMFEIIRGQEKLFQEALALISKTTEC